tara:strand:+ start:728 stop:967 length:240 start_codon:yes stop_codon:yes gene_type:complete
VAEPAWSVLNSGKFAAAFGQQHSNWLASIAPCIKATSLSPEKSRISEAFEFGIEIAQGMTTPNPALWVYRSFLLAKPRI